MTIFVFSNNSFAKNDLIDLKKFVQVTVAQNQLKNLKFQIFFLKQETVKQKTTENVCFGLEIKKIK